MFSLEVTTVLIYFGPISSRPPANKEKAFTCASANYKIEEVYDSLRLFQPQKPKMETLDRLEIEVSRRKLYQPWGPLFNSGSCKGELSKFVFLGYLHSFVWSSPPPHSERGWLWKYWDSLCSQRLGISLSPLRGWFMFAKGGFQPVCHHCGKCLRDASGRKAYFGSGWRFQSLV